MGRVMTAVAVAQGLVGLRSQRGGDGYCKLWRMQLIWEQAPNSKRSAASPGHTVASLSEQRQRQRHRPYSSTIHPSVDKELRGSSLQPITTTMSQTEQAQHADSISSQDPSRDETKKTKSRRPPSESRAIVASARKRQRKLTTRQTLRSDNSA